MSSKQPSGYEPSLSTGQKPPNTYVTGNEPSLAIDAAMRDLLDALASFNPVEREAAIELLVEQGERALPALLSGLHSSNRSAQIGAVRAVQLIGNTDMIPHLLAIFSDDDWMNWGVFHALLALGEEGEQALIEAFQGEHHDAIARQVTQTQLDTETTQFLTSLVQASVDDLSELLKIYNVKPDSKILNDALIEHGDAAAKRLLVAIEQHSHPPFDPFESVELLLRIVMVSSNAALCERIIYSVHRFYGYHRSWKKLWMVENLLRSISYRHPNASVRQRSASVMRQIRQTARSGFPK